MTATTAIEYRNDADGVALLMLGDVEQMLFQGAPKATRATLVDALNEAVRLGAEHGICTPECSGQPGHPTHAVHVVDLGGLARLYDYERHAIITVDRLSELPDGVVDALDSAWTLGRLSTRLV